MTKEVVTDVEEVASSEATSPSGEAIAQEFRAFMQMLEKPEVLAFLQKHLDSAGKPASPASPTSSSKAMPKGIPFQLDVASVGVGSTEQLTIQVPTACTLCGVQVEEGLEIVQVFAGPHVLKDNFESVNKPLQPSAWITVLAKNLTSEPKIARGKVFLEGDGLKPEAASPGFDAAFGTPSAPAVAPPAPPYVFSQAPTPSAPVAPLADVKPGANEVVVLLSYGEAQRLLQMVTGGVPIYDYERPAFERRFKSALGMP